MKKYYSTLEYKINNKRNVLRRNRLRRKRRDKVYISTIPNNNSNKYKDFIFIDVPNNFSIVNNSKEVINFIDKIESVISKEKPIFIEMKNVSNVSLDAIIYTIAFFDKIREQKIAYKIDGSFPYDKKARKLIQESGFLKYIYPHANIEVKTDILTIKEGFKVDSSIAKDVTTYLREKLNIDRSKTKSIFTILVESMANTYNHAFSKDSLSVFNKWYLSAFYFEGEVHFVFLDNGRGIAKTIKKKIFKDLLKTDSELILSALEGIELRSNTGETKRGKGLPKIYNKAKDCNIRELIIIANKGLINAKDGISTQIENDFKGTLLSWKIINTEEKCNVGN
jgi:hypothetical protein